MDSRNNERGDGHEGTRTRRVPIVPKEKSSTWPWLKWVEAFEIRIGVLLLLGCFCLAILVWKASYHHQECKVGTYLFGLLSYTTFREVRSVFGITYFEFHQDGILIENAIKTIKSAKPM